MTHPSEGSGTRARRPNANSICVVPTRRNRGTMKLGPMIFALLLEGPISWVDLKDRLNLGNASADRWYGAMREQGILRVCGHAPYTENPTGKRARIFELQKPWANPDEPYPHTQPKPKAERIPRKPKLVPNSVFDLARCAEAV